VVEEHRNYHGKYLLTLVFASIFLFSLGILVQTASADSIISTISVGSGPTDVAVNPTTNMIYVINYNDNTISAINGTTNSVVSTIPVGSKPVFAAVNPVTNKIYVSNTFSNSVSVIDGAANSVVSTISTGFPPYGIGINPNTNKIYIACQYCQTAWVVDGRTDTIVKTLTGFYHNQGVGVDPSTNMIYVTGSIYRNDNGITIINGTTDNVTGNIQFGFNPFYVGVNPNSNDLYVGDYGQDKVFLIDGATNSVVNTIPVGSSPYGVGVNPNTNKIYVANFGSNAVSIIDGTTNSVVSTIPVGSNPWGVGINPNTNKIYIANQYSRSVTVIDGNPSTGTSTTLTLNPISPSSVPWSGTITVSGKLTDQSNTGLGAKTITFSGTGAANLGTITTSPDGTFTVSGLSPDTVSTGWTVQAHFAGDPSYSSSDSNTRTYNTVLHSTKLTQLYVRSVPWGQPTSITATLVDRSAGGIVVSSKTITWTGTGVIGVSSATTNSTGMASSGGLAPNTVSMGWTVQAHFAGDASYSSSDSNTRTYNTVVHFAKLSLVVSPSSLPHGEIYKVYGILSDSTLGGIGLDSMTITFTADSPIVIESTVATSSGSYTVGSLTAPDIIGTFNIQSHFSGTSLYGQKDSLVKTITTT
jgi:YVTN family beta-propeller protein